MTQFDTVRALVVDDEVLGRKKICRMLKEDPDVQLLGDASGGTEALSKIQHLQPNLLFLDVNMPDMDGFRLLEEIDGPEPPFVIFVTAYDHFALRAFQVHALDYLLKPFDRERFSDALQRAKATIRKQQSDEFSKQMFMLLQNGALTKHSADRILVKSGGSISFLRPDEIDWIEAQGAYVCLYAHGKKHLVREKISEFEAQLAPKNFVRIHRSTIVNIDRIKEMHPMFYGEYSVILQDGTKLLLSRSYREKVFMFLTKPS